MLGAALAGVGVALGAFGAHALRDALSEKQLDWWATAQHYQVWHALALLLLGFAAGGAPEVVDPAGLAGGGSGIAAAILAASPYCYWKLDQPSGTAIAPRRSRPEAR